MSGGPLFQLPSRGDSEVEFDLRFSLSEVHCVCPEEDEPLLAHEVVHVEDVGGGEVVLQSLPLVQLRSHHKFIRCLKQWLVYLININDLFDSCFIMFYPIF